MNEKEKEAKSKRKKTSLSQFAIPYVALITHYAKSSQLLQPKYELILIAVVDTIFCPGLKSKFSSIESCFRSRIHFSLNPNLSPYPSNPNFQVQDPFPFNPNFVQFSSLEVARDCDYIIVLLLLFITTIFIIIYYTYFVLYCYII